MKKITWRNNISINTAVSRFLFSYRNTPQSTTGRSPSELLNNRSLNSRITRLKPQIYETQKENELTEVRKKAQEKTRILYPGDCVYVRNFRKGSDKWVKGSVKNRVSGVSYNVIVDGIISHKHIDQLRYRYTDIDYNPNFDSDIVNMSNDKLLSRQEESLERNENIDNECRINLPSIPVPKSSGISTDSEKPEYENTVPDQNPNRTIITDIQLPVSPPSALPSLSERPKRNTRPPSYLKDYET